MDSFFEGATDAIAQGLANSDLLGPDARSEASFRQMLVLDAIVFAQANPRTVFFGGVDAFDFLSAQQREQIAPFMLGRFGAGAAVAYVLPFGAGIAMTPLSSWGSALDAAGRGGDQATIIRSLLFDTRQ